MSRKWALITGAASDIGVAIAAELSKEYDLILTDLDQEALDSAAAQCSGEADVRTLVLRLDECDQLEDALGEYLSREGLVISKYVHCAGIARRLPIKMIKADHYMDAFKVNVVSSAMIIKVLVSRKNKKALDSCVLLASTAALRGVKTFSVYGSTKSAVIGLAENLAIELAPGCRVNTVSPGAIRTRATAEIMDEKTDVFESKYPLGMGTPDKLTGTVRFLLSDEAGWITGQNIVVDGGRTVDGTD